MRVPPNRALELLGRELNLFTEKKEIVEAQGEVAHKLERQLLPPPEAAPECYQALGNAAPARAVPNRQVPLCHLTIAVRPQVAKWTSCAARTMPRAQWQWDLF